MQLHYSGGGVTPQPEGPCPADPSSGVPQVHNDRTNGRGCHAGREFRRVGRPRRDRDTSHDPGTNGAGSREFSAPWRPRGQSGGNGQRRATWAATEGPVQGIGEPAGGHGGMR